MSSLNKELVHGRGLAVQLWGVYPCDVILPRLDLHLGRPHHYVTQPKWPALDAQPNSKAA